jgi:4-aminobutyrate aminotransferase-like enzyme/Ser/Thr protein kinase RdoA (MazF antagonist)
MAEIYDDLFLGRLEAGLRDALPRWGLSSGTELQLLTISENATFRASDPKSGSDVIFRVHRPGYHSKAEIGSELAWVEALRRDGVVATLEAMPQTDGELIADIDDEGVVRHVVAFGMLPGKEPDEGEDLARWFRELGAVNARLHAHARNWRKPADFVRKVWDFDAMLGEVQLWGDWRAGPGLNAQGRAVLEQTAALLGELLKAYGKEEDRFGLVHADMRLANLLVDGDTLFVIDFDDCGFSWFLYDFAAAISFKEHESYIPALQAAWIEGYRTVAPLSDEDCAMIPVFVMLRRMLLTAWIASHSETPMAQAMGEDYTHGTVALARTFLDSYAPGSLMTSESKPILSLNAFGGASDDLQPDVAALVKRRRRSFGAGSVLFYDEPLHFVRAEGAYLYASDGRAYLDFYNNVPTVGHCHPRVVEAVRRQVGELNIHSRYLFDIAHDYAEKLLATFPAELSNLALTCTGSEANDLALRIARRASGGTGFIVTEAAYHGNTAAVTEVSPSSYKHGHPPPHVRMVPAPDPAKFGTDVAQGFGDAVAAAIAGMQADGIRFAGLLVDTIFSSDGVFADPAGFLAPAVEVARRAGGLFIADEVQPGFGRTGSGLWGFSRHGIVPDIVTLGKPMGNGYPIGGVVTRPELLGAYAADFGYFNTFAASPVATAAAMAVLDAIEEDRLIDNAASTGAHLASRLSRLQAKAPISAVRGAGLYLGVELRDAAEPLAELASHLVNGLRRQGILIGTAGRCGNVLKIRPPLCVNVGHADQLADAVEELLASAG